MGLFGNLFDKKEKPQDLICNYSVVYRGGHPDYPKEKNAAIDFFTCADRFEFHSTLSSKSWFNGIIIPFEKIKDLEIVQRQVGSLEGILGGLDSRQLNQANNIHIKYDLNGQEILLRVEMLSGITVMGQAKKCLEFQDRLKINNIRNKFLKVQSENKGMIENDIPTQLEKIKSLLDKGILTQEEFNNKKTELLSKM